MLGNIFRKLESENCGTTYVSLLVIAVFFLLMVLLVSVTTILELSLHPNSLAISAFLYGMSKINDAVAIKSFCSVPVVGSNWICVRRFYLHMYELERNCLVNSQKLVNIDRNE